MLLELHVKNLALIDEIEVEFGRGLNILTGGADRDGRCGTGGRLKHFDR